MADVTAAQRKMFAKMGIAMPDGSYYVRNAADLQNAIDSVGRGENAGDNGNAIRKHIMARAAALKLQSKIPSTWNSDGSLKHFSYDEFFLTHFGIKGMRWGVRKPGTGAASTHISSDAARANILKATVSKHGVHALSNQDLQHLVTRQNLERQHGQLNPEKISTGRSVVNELLKVGSSVAKQQATVYANKYAAEGIDALIKRAA